jgi:hypothetical protein
VTAYTWTIGVPAWVTANPETGLVTVEVDLSEADDPDNASPVEGLTDIPSEAFALVQQVLNEQKCTVEHVFKPTLTTQQAYADLVVSLKEQVMQLTAASISGDAERLRLVQALQALDGEVTVLKAKLEGRLP